MNEKYIDLMETSINEKNFHIEEWERTKAMLRFDTNSGFNFLNLEDI